MSSGEHRDGRKLQTGPSSASAQEPQSLRQPGRVAGPHVCKAGQILTEKKEPTKSV